MSDNPEDPEIGNAEDIDPGESIPALAGLEHDASSGLVKRIRRAIHRRTTVGHLASFSVSIPSMLLREIWSILIKRPNPIDTRKDASHGEKTS
jgi:hypothetical protein